MMDEQDEQVSQDTKTQPQTESNRHLMNHRWETKSSSFLMEDEVFMEENEATVDPPVAGSAIIPSIANVNRGKDDDNEDDRMMDSNDGDDDDDSSSLASALSSSSSSTSSYLSSDNDNDNDHDDDRDRRDGEVLTTTTTTKVGSTLMERQARNMERNAKFLIDLNEKYKDHFPPTLNYLNNKRRSNLASDKEREDTTTTTTTAGGRNDDERLIVTTNDLWMKDSHRRFNSFPIIEDHGGVSSSSNHSTINTTCNRHHHPNDSSSYSYSHLVGILNERYPHRYEQIRQLAATLSATANATTHPHGSRSDCEDNSCCQVYVPSPVFCIGPTGTGKTSIVCDVVEVIQKTSASWKSSSSPTPPTKATTTISDVVTTSSSSREGPKRDNSNMTTNSNTNNSNNKNNHNKIRAAYIDCSILEPSTIERLVYSAYQQLRPSGVDGVAVQTPTPKSRGRFHHHRHHHHGVACGDKGTRTNKKKMMPKGGRIQEPRQSTTEQLATQQNHVTSDSNPSEQLFDSQTITGEMMTNQVSSSEGGGDLFQAGKQHRSITTTTGDDRVTQWNDENVRSDNSNGSAAATHNSEQVLSESTKVTVADAATTQNNNYSFSKDKPNIVERRTMPSRGVKRVSISGSTDGRNDSNMSRRPTTTSHRKRKKNDTAMLFENGNNDGSSDSRNDAVETSHHSPVVAFGRSLEQYYGTSSITNSRRTTKLTTRIGGPSPSPENTNHSTPMGILILDKAEELLSLSSSNKTRKRKQNSQGGGHSSTGSATPTSTSTNYLSELLLLPKIMKLNITVIVISNYSTLDKTRLNNNVAPSRSLATISNGIHPIMIQFPAYRGYKMFRDIHTTQQNMRLVMGDTFLDKGISTMRGSLRDKIVRLFWNTLIQSISDSTRNIYEFIRLGRALWPWFVAPLHPGAIRTTMEGVTNKLHIPLSEISRPEHSRQVEDEIANVLGTRFHQHVSSLSYGEESLTCVSLDEAGLIVPMKLIASSRVAGRSNDRLKPCQGQQPCLRTCLLLAAFICQHNKADHDRKIFSTHGNGRRRKSRAKDDLYGGNDEDLAFGSSTSGDAAQQRGEQLKSLRPRPFPLERALSIFVTLVRLNPAVTERATLLPLGTVTGRGEDLETLMDSLGSTRLHTDVQHLIDSGYLHRASFQGSIKAEQISLSNARFWCSLTKEEAIEIAEQLDIPLEKYLI